MDWSRIKTIFIITFLLLDIFLAYEVIAKRSRNQLDVLTDTSIEEKLEADEIKYVDLPKEVVKDTYISAQSKTITDEELKQLKLSKKQEITLINSVTIQSKVKEELYVPEKNKQFFFNQFLKEYVYNGEQYQYWKVDENEKSVYFFQKYKGKVIYYNNSAMVILKYDDENKVIGYEQTMLAHITDMEPTGGSQELIPAIKALEILYEKNEIPSKSKVTKVELGYFKLIPDETDIQVITPTWHFVVNDESDLFVNAIEGQVVRLELKNGVKKYEPAF